jgi:O-antigen/teichoic acid export membrane protein
MLFNIFHGVTVNAAMGIAMQVNTAVFSFVRNFQTAFRPQIIKSYAAGEHDYFMRLIFQASKTSFFLLIFFLLPLCVNADFVLHIWLKNVPEHAVAFMRLILICSLIEALTGPLAASIMATGDIKKYELVLSCFLLSNIPLAFLLLLMGISPVWVLIGRFGLNILALCWRISFLSVRINLPIKSFYREVIIPVLIIAAIPGMITIYSNSFFTGWTGLGVSCIVSSLSICSLVYFVGFNKRERFLLKKLIREKICS